MTLPEEITRSADPVEDLQKILTPEEIQDLVDGLFLLRAFWGKPTGFGEIRMMFEPGSMILRASPERKRKR